MFDDDSFGGIDELFNQFVGRRHSQHSTKNQTQNLLNTIELKKETILVFDMSGKKIVSVEIKDNLETNEYGERIHNKKVLEIKFENNETMKYEIPKVLTKRKVNHTFNNGILEVSLKK